jgi:uncharacterized protein YdhG (YjbR/CyaY superfamily)
MPAPRDVDAYLAGFPDAVGRHLAQVRAVVRRAAPKAQETISYRIPAYKQDGVLVYFAAHTAHIGLYPITLAVRKELGPALAPYLAGAATARFPHERPIPRTLIARIVKIRLRENRERAEKRKKR